MASFGLRVVVRRVGLDRAIDRRHDHRRLQCLDLPIGRQQRPVLGRGHEVEADAVAAVVSVGAIFHRQREEAVLLVRRDRHGARRRGEPRRQTVQGFLAAEEILVACVRLDEDLDDVAPVPATLDHLKILAVGHQLVQNPFELSARDLELLRRQLQHP